MSSAQILSGLAGALAAGSIRVVDLMQTLSEDTPLLVLPDPFVQTAAHIVDWEAAHGPNPPRSWVLLRTDWSKRDSDAYTNRHSDGADTPGPATDAVELLIARDLLGLGVETIGTDAGQAHLLTPSYPVHTLLHGTGRYSLQCLENLDRLPPTGAILVCPPLKIRDGSGSPLRVIALVEG